MDEQPRSRFYDEVLLEHARASRLTQDCNCDARAGTHCTLILPVVKRIQVYQRLLEKVFVKRSVPKN